MNSRVLWLTSILFVASAARGHLLAGPLLQNQTFEAGERPSSILTADFNNDGRPDLAVANVGSDDLSILLGRGDGTFGRQRRYLVGPGPRFVVQADFNGDGLTDLAVVHGAGVSFLFGEGDGSFGSPDTWFTGVNPQSAAAGDFNRDGRPDLLVSNAGQAVCVEDCSCPDSSISVLLNQGDARFSLRNVSVGGNTCAAEVVTADFDQDGIEDVALTGAVYGNPNKENLSLFPGHGDGTFGPQLPSMHLTVRTPLGQGDFDEDGKPDLVVVRDSPRNITILLGTGGGQFTSGASYPGGGNDLTVGDLNGDGHSDVIVSNSEDEVVRYLGRGDGNFTRLPGVVAGTAPAQLALGDFNGDQRQDVAVTCGSHSTGISVLMGRASGNLGIEPPPNPLEPGARALVSADFNRDHVPDLAMVNEYARALILYSGNGDGTFRLAWRSPTGSNPYALAAGDLNGDGTLDVAVANLGSSDVSVLFGTGAGSFFTFSPRFPAGRNPRGIAMGRFNADTFPDLVVANQTSGDISVLLGPAWNSQSLYKVRSDPFSVSTGDFDGNGFDDIAVANYLGCNCLSLFSSRGDGSFSFSGEPPAGARPTSVTATDLDLDGRLDLVATNDHGSFGGQVSILKGRGDGSFENARQVPVGDEPLALTVADFNGDGLTDLATADRSANDVAVLLATAPGRFSRAMRFGVGREPWSIASGDFNSDGRPDLAVLDFISNDVRLLLNQGFENHAPVARIRTEGDPECSSRRGWTVELDASASADPDSTPGTNDDILSFQWYEGYEGASESYLGSGEQLEVDLPLGAHPITLVATDGAGMVATASTIIQAVDTTPPDLAVRLSRSLLWPPDQRMVDILADVQADDACGEPSVVLLRISSNESGDVPVPGGASWAPDIQGAELGTLDLRFQLRAARDGHGAGRTYTVTYQATDRFGNVSTVDSIVYVPISLFPADRPGTRPTTLQR